MTKGYVYILSNPSMPGLLKIGKTTRSVEQRCAELWQTGVPAPFVIVEQFLSPDCHALEASVHAYLRELRTSHAREFFGVEQDVAIQIVKDALREQIELLIFEFIPGEVLVDREEFVDPGELGAVAHRANIDPKELAEAFSFMRPNEVMPAVTRWREARLRRGIVRNYRAAGSE